MEPFGLSPFHMTITQSANRQILLKLLIASVMMFGFGYALVPMYKALCEVTGINVVTSKNDYGVRAFSPDKVGNTQVNFSRTVTIEFDSNSRGDRKSTRLNSSH